MERIFNTDPMKLLLDLEEFYRTYKWHQEGGRDRKDHACLIVAISILRDTKYHAYASQERLYDVFMTHPKVQEVARRFPYGTTSVAVLIAFNDDASTTWEGMQELFAYAKEQLSQRS